MLKRQAFNSIKDYHYSPTYFFGEAFNTFNSIKDYPTYRPYLFLEIHRYFQFHQGLSHNLHGGAMSMQIQVQTFNSIKDYRYTENEKPLFSPIRLSIPSRIINGTASWPFVRRPCNLSIPSRIIQLFGSSLTSLGLFLSIPSRIIEVKTFLLGILANNLIFQFHQGLSDNTDIWLGGIILHFQFHQGLSQQGVISIIALLHTFQFHQGLSSIHDWGSCPQSQLSIPSRIIGHLRS